MNSSARLPDGGVSARRACRHDPDPRDLRCPSRCHRDRPRARRERRRGHLLRERSRLPGGGVPKGTPEAAVTAANGDSAFDTIRIGPGTYNTSSGLWASQPVAIVGAGRDATEIVLTDAGAGVVVGASTSSSVSKLSVRLTKPFSQGIGLDKGADVTDVSVSAA